MITIIVPAWLAILAAVVLVLIGICCIVALIVLACLIGSLMLTKEDAETLDVDKSKGWCRP